MDRLDRHIQVEAAESQDDGAFRLAARWVEVACPETSAERQHIQDAELDTHAWPRCREGWEISS